MAAGELVLVADLLLDSPRTLPGGLHLPFEVVRALDMRARSLLSAAVARARAEGCGLVSCGNLFDAENLTRESLVFVAGRLADLEGLPTYLVAGELDRAGDRSPYDAGWLERIGCVPMQKHATVLLSREEAIQVTGLPAAAFDGDPGCWPRVGSHSGGAVEWQRDLPGFPVVRLDSPAQLDELELPRPGEAPAPLVLVAGAPAAGLLPVPLRLRDRVLAIAAVDPVNREEARSPLDASAAAGRRLLEAADRVAGVDPVARETALLVLNQALGRLASEAAT